VDEHPPAHDVLVVQSSPEPAATSEESVDVAQKLHEAEPVPEAANEQQSTESVADVDQVPEVRPFLLVISS
jgi:hypothetical protein